MAKRNEQEQEQEQRAGGDAGAQEVRENAAQEREQGFRGVEVDPTPNENYTVSGVTGGAPTPETDEGARRAADERLRAVRDAGAPDTDRR